MAVVATTTRGTGRAVVFAADMNTSIRRPKGVLFAYMLAQQCEKRGDGGHSSQAVLAKVGYRV
jgi:hypothetical protein